VSGNNYENFDKMRKKQRNKETKKQRKNDFFKLKKICKLPSASTNYFLCGVNKFKKKFLFCSNCTFISKFNFQLIDNISNIFEVTVVKIIA
jgi:hypothetical protein